MVTIERLGDDELLTPTRRTDDLGAVSVHARADPGQAPGLEATRSSCSDRRPQAAFGLFGLVLADAVAAVLYC